MVKKYRQSNKVQSDLKYLFSPCVFLSFIEVGNCSLVYLTLMLTSFAVPMPKSLMSFQIILKQVLYITSVGPYRSCAALLDISKTQGFHRVLFKVELGLLWFVQVWFDCLNSV